VSTGWLMQGPPGAETVLNGKPYLYFAGTGCLGLQSHPAVLQAAAAAVLEYGLHTATSRAGFGTNPLVLEVERRAAEFLSAETAAYLVSGYAVNFAIATALAAEVELVLLDESAHDCLREATRHLDRLQQPPIVFRHRDAGHVAELLAAHARIGRRALIMTDGVFAVSGHIAPVADFLSILERYDGSLLLVDDAHGLAAIGEAGRGSLEWAGVEPARINRWDEGAAVGTRVFQGATLSKAVGGQGGIIAGTTAFVERVRRTSGWLRGAGAPAVPVAAATAKALAIVQDDPDLRRRLADNVKLLRAKLRDLGLVVEDSPSPIVGITLESTEAMQAVWRQLIDAGIAVGFTRDYAGAGDLGMLRIAVFATHTPAMIERLVEGLRRAL
jgi:7-keto-8-aminopelargonate synthetase-like enzyme